jgi:hypothetical protein
VAQVVEHLPVKHKDLSSNPNAAKKKGRVNSGKEMMTLMKLTQIIVKYIYNIILFKICHYHKTHKTQFI